VLERGSGKPLSGVEVYVLDLDRALLTDEDGRFEAALSPGGYALTIAAKEHHPYEALERLASGDTLEMTYYVETRRGGRYRTVVWGSEGKSMVGRTTLEDAEIHEVPGTMGDPIRVIMLLPGVTSSVTGFGYPVVRGVLPGDTRYEVDGIQVPMLYHLIVGNSVVNPRFTTGLTFQPGGYSVKHGGFPGALIMADVDPAERKRTSYADVSLIHGSLYHAEPIGEGGEVVAAARYGTLGLIIEALASNTVFRYWDYQTRGALALGSNDRLELVVFGAGNAVGDKPPGEKESVLTLGFHRAAARWRHRFTRGWAQSALEAGYEIFLAPPDDAEPPADGSASEDSGLGRSTYRYEAWRNDASYTVADDVELHLGAEGSLQQFRVGLSDLTVPKRGITLGAYLEGSWTPGPWTVVPGVRIDDYRYGLHPGARERSVDPRLSIGFEASDKVTLKAAAGIYHGPPRVTLVDGPLVIGPVPGLMGIGLEYGLSRSRQLAVAIETKLPARLELSLQGYYSALHTAVDFSLMSEDLSSEGTDDPLFGTDGRSYGMELMLRRRPGDGVFGWLTYSVTRSERDIAGIGTLPFVFDQRHVVNAVLSWEVGRHWTLGTTFHANSGRPYTPQSLGPCPDGSGLSCALDGAPLSKRLPWFWRIDARVQKRELFDTWYFDFYIDVINLTFNQETIGYELDERGAPRAVKVPIFVPMVGIRGEI